MGLVILEGGEDEGLLIPLYFSSRRVRVSRSANSSATDGTLGIDAAMRAATGVLSNGVLPEDSPSPLYCSWTGLKMETEMAEAGWDLFCGTLVWM